MSAPAQLDTPKVWLIGGTSLLRKCTEQLLAQGFAVEGILTDDPELRPWAAELGIPVHANTEHARVLQGRGFDYLFSVVNPHILKTDVLSIPRRATINYHDGPLPRYAGVHSTSWALLNQEQAHGITWHLVTEAIDAGAIVAQQVVPITRGETAFSLNARCYQAAFEQFQQLLPRLREQRFPGPLEKQPSAQRSYFGKHQKPAAGGLLDLSESAEAVVARIRALDFGPIRNPFAAPVIDLGHEQLIVGRGKVLAARRASDAPGTVLAANEDSLVVATATHEIELDRLKFGGDRSRSLQQVLAQNGRSIGSAFPLPSDELKSAYRSELEASSRFEQHWVAALQAVEPIALPAGSPGGESRRGHAAIRLSELGPELSTAVDIAAVFLGYLAKLLNCYRFTIGVQRGSVGIAQRFFASVTPLNVDVDRSSTWSAHASTTSSAIRTDLERRAYAKDIFFRYPELEDRCGLSLPLIVSNDEPATGAAISLTLREDAVHLDWDASALSRRLQEKLETFGEWLTTMRGSAVIQTIGQTTVLSRRDLDEQLIEWNRTALEFRRDLLLHELFEQQARETPTAIAVRCRQFQLSYAELNERADQLAAALAGPEFAPETPIGVCLDRSSMLLVALLGILKAGGTYVPLDPGYPLDRLEFIARDGKLATVLTNSRHRETFRRADIATLDIENLPRPAAGSQRDLARRSKPSDVAYIIYTSGSTGRPKGVAIPHLGAVALLSWVKHEFGDELRLVLGSTSVCFDLSIIELLAPLAAGGCCVIVDNFLDWLRTEQDLAVTMISSVPSVARELIRALERDSPQSARIRSTLTRNLRSINVGGEPVPRSLVDAFYREFPQVHKVRDLYGPSEYTTLTTTAWRRPNDVETVGRPIGNTQVYLLDAGLSPILVGAVGELYVGGVGLARGYVNRPELTQESFIRNPFDERGGSFYRTRDQCRYLDDGRVVFIGRNDEQVKVRGFRIELGEIEHTLTAHPEVDASFLTTFQDADGRAQIAAYVVASKAPNIADIRQTLGRTLAPYMIPSVFIHVTSLPLLPNGKIDRRALPPPVVDRSLLAAFEPPEGPLAQALAAIWSEVLGVEQVGARDNFFALGGQSLLAVRVLEKLEEMHGIRLGIGDLFSYPTVSELAEHIANHVASSGSATTSTPTTLESADVPSAASHNHAEPSRSSVTALPDECFMGPSQWAFWFEYHPQQFNVPLHVPISGRAQHELVPEILDALPRVFPLLGYRAGRFSPKLFREPHAAVPITHIDLPGASAVERAEALRHYFYEHPFDFKRRGATPQMHGVLAKLDPDRSLLALRYPHYYGDGYSNQILERVILSWLKTGRISARPSSFTDAIALDQQGLSDADVARAKAHWSRILRNAKASRVPQSWFSRTEYKARAVLDLDRTRAERLRQTHGLLMRTLYTAALSACLREMLDTPQLVIRNFILRKPPTADASIYPRLFLEAFPIHIPGTASKLDLIRHAQEVTAQVLKDGDASVPLVLNGLLDPTAGTKNGWKRGLASAVAGTYGALIDAGESQMRVLHESMSSLLTQANQVDFFLNFMPEPPSLSEDPTFVELLRELKGRYMRKCTGGVRSLCCLDVFEDGAFHRLSLDSPFSSEIDRQILTRVAEFMDV